VTSLILNDVFIVIPEPGRISRKSAGSGQAPGGKTTFVPPAPYLTRIPNGNQVHARTPPHNLGRRHYAHKKTGNVKAGILAGASNHPMRR
jgi:hypothetical protein